MRKHGLRPRGGDNAEHRAIEVNHEEEEGGEEGEKEDDDEDEEEDGEEDEAAVSVSSFDSADLHESIANYFVLINVPYRPSVYKSASSELNETECACLCNVHCGMLGRTRNGT